VDVDGDVVNGMAAYQPVVLVCVLCAGRKKGLHPGSTQYTYQHNRLICRHTIDYVTINVHIKNIYIALAKHWGTP
jgi:2-C-methyl-D-erythritol 4-phosphate cytidylyltransferase